MSRSGPAGNLVLEALVQAAEVNTAAPVDLAQEDHAHEHQGRRESRECAEEHDAETARMATFLFHNP